MATIERIRKRKKRRLAKLILFSVFLSLVVILFLFFRLSPTKEQAVITDTPYTSPKLTIPQLSVDLPPNSKPLGDAIQSELIGTHGSYGIVVINLKTGESYVQNAEKVYLSGSLYKLWVMAEVYQQLKEGKLHQTDILQKNITDLNKEFDIDSDDAERKSGKISYCVQDALYQMITISDNYAALLLADKVGLNDIALFLQENKFSQSKVGMHGKDPVTTPWDIALFFDKLYKGQLIDRTNSNKMLALLKQQRLNDKIPEYLPTNVVVAHKTGELDDVTHDGGIVYAPNGDYIIVVLSQIDDRELANERIANVSKAVYQYFNP